jgi:hypothetical protein
VKPKRRFSQTLSLSLVTCLMIVAVGCMKSESTKKGDTTTLAAPTGLTATSTATAINLSWNAVSGASYYFVLRGPSQSYDPNTWTIIGYTTTTSATNSTTDTSYPVTAGTTYYYGVVASTDTNATVISDLSNIVSGKTTGISIPTTPTGLSVTKGVYPTTIVITWTAVSNASSYNVYRSTSSSGTYTKIGYSTSTNAINSTASPASFPITSSTYYYYKVTAVDSSSNESLYSSYDYGYSAITSAQASIKIVNKSSYNITEFRGTYSTTSDPTCSYLTPSTYGSNSLSSSLLPNYFTWVTFPGGAYIDWYVLDSYGYYSYDDMSSYGTYGSHYFLTGECYTLVWFGSTSTYYASEYMASMATVEGVADSGLKQADFSIYYIPGQGFVNIPELKSDEVSGNLIVPSQDVIKSIKQKIGQ